MAAGQEQCLFVSEHGVPVITPKPKIAGGQEKFLRKGQR